MKVDIRVGEWAPYTDQEKGRSPGLHMAEAVRVLMRQRDPEKFQDRAKDDMDWGRMELGSAWELYDRTKRLRRGALILSGQEYELDGLICTPDGWMTRDIKGSKQPVPRIVEWKLAWASSNRSVEDWHWYWIVQVKGYCHVLSQRVQPVRHASIYAVYVNGNYKPMAPECREIHLAFTDRDLIENWRLILGAAKTLKSQAKKGRERWQKTP